jgi:hypothetical protein
LFPIFSHTARYLPVTADGEALAISVPAGETRVLKYFQERMPLWALRAERSLRTLGTRTLLIKIAKGESG